MKIRNYVSVTPTPINNDQAKGVAGRVVIGENEGANNFCMRILRLHRKVILPCIPMPGSTKSSFMRVLAKLTAMETGTTCCPEPYCLSRLMKNIKFAIPEKNCLFLPV